MTPEEAAELHQCYLTSLSYIGAFFREDKEAMHLIRKETGCGELMWALMVLYIAELQERVVPRGTSHEEAPGLITAELNRMTGVVLGQMSQS